MSTTKRLTKAFSDAIPLGPHPNPHGEWVPVRLDFVQEGIDHLEWLEKGNAEWREIGMVERQRANAAQAKARIAIAHLQSVLNKARTHAEQQAADTFARDWLISIGSEPS